MLRAIVLAAGDSTRMGSPKALLTAPDGRTFVARVVRSLGAAGLADVTVVTGRDHAAILDAIAADGPPAFPRVVRNQDPSRGQLSSLLIGMNDVIAHDTDGLLVTLVDVPLVEVATIERVIEMWQSTRAPVVRPAIGDRHGHPVIFDRSVFDEIRSASLTNGVKTVVRAHAGDLINVPVSDQGCLVDVDTPSDYETMRRP